MAASNSSVITCFVLNILTALIAFIVFSYLRLSDQCIKFYAPRRYARDIRLKPRRLQPGGMFSWVKAVWSYSEGEIIDEVGLDAAIYLRVLNFGLRLFFWVSLWCLIAVLPVNLTGNEIAVQQAATAGDANPVEFVGFDKCSLSNVSPNTSRLWMHTCSVYVITGIVCYLLNRFNRESVNLRVMFLALGMPSGATHTVLVTDIPGIMPPPKEGKGLVGKLTGRGSKKDAGKEEGDEGAAGVNGAKAVGEGRASFDRDGGGSVQNHMGSALNSMDLRGVATPEAGAVGFASPSARALHGGRSPSAGPVAEAAEASTGVEDVVMEVADSPRARRSQSKTQRGPQEALRRRHSYNARDPRLNARVEASRKLAEGMSPQGLVESEFRDVYDGVQVTVNPVQEQASLQPLVDEYDKIRQKLDDYLDECNFRMDKGMYVERKTVLVLGSMGDWGKARGYGLWNKPDAIDHWTARLDELSRLIVRKQGQCRERITSTAFVTFSTRVAQCTSAASLHYHDETVWRTQNAPAPFEVVWSNLPMKVAERSSRSVTLTVLFVLMTLFFMIPVLFIQGLIDVPTLASSGILHDVFTAPVLEQLIQAIVPGLVLVIFLAMVPTILAAMMRYSGAVSLSEIDFGVVRRYFIFQVVVVFFYNVIGGSFFTSLHQWIDKPASAITILGTAIPTVSTFFITYILINGVGKGATGLLRIVPMVIHWIFTKLASSPKAQQRLWSEQYVTYGALVSHHTMTILLGIVYCLINPIIAPTVLLYFVINTCVERYQNIYVYRRHYESGGRMWASVFHQVMFALYLFQVCMLGLLGIKKFPATVIIIPCILATIVFHFSTVNLFSRPWSLVALHDAAALDRAEREKQARSAIESLPGSAAEQQRALTGGGGGGAGGSRFALALPAAAAAPSPDRYNRSSQRQLLDDGHRDTEDSADVENADGLETETAEPLERVYQSRLFKLQLPEELQDLMTDKGDTVARIAAQGPPPTKAEVKARKRAQAETDKQAKLASKAEAKAQKAGGRRHAGDEAQAEAVAAAEEPLPVATSERQRSLTKRGPGAV